MSDERINIAALRERAAKFTPYGANRVRADHLLALVEAAEAARDMDEWLRRFSEEPAPGHPGYGVRMQLRRAVARFFFGEKP